MKRAILATLSLAAIAWAVHAFWVQDHSLPRYDPTKVVVIAVVVSLVAYAALSAGMEWVKGRERFVYPFLGFALWGLTLGRLFLVGTAYSMLALMFAVLPALLLVKAVQLVARDAEQEELNQAGPQA